MQFDVLQRRAAKIPVVNVRSPNRLNYEFRLFPDMNFTCSGSISSLLLGVDIRTVSEDRNQYPEIQIWRNIGGSFVRKSGKQKIQLVEGDFSPDGVLLYNLTPPLQFQTGDIFGVYQPPQSDSVVRLYYSEDDSGSTSLQIKSIHNPSIGSLRSNLLRKVIGQSILLSPITGKRIYILCLQ